jgi:hypothetical protein
MNFIVTSFGRSLPPMDFQRLVQDARLSGKDVEKVSHLLPGRQMIAEDNLTIIKRIS